MCGVDAFWTVQQLSGVEYYPLYAVVSLISVALLVLAYHNTKSNVHVRLLSNRPEVHAPIGEKNVEKAKKGELAAASARAATASEAGSFAVLYNTLLFIATFVLLGFFLLSRFLPATYNYPVASILSAGLVLAASRAH